MRALGQSPQDPLFDPNVLEACPFAGARLVTSRDARCETPPAQVASVEEAYLGLFGRSLPVLSLTPETGYEELVADRESIGSGGTMVGGSSRLGALRAYGGYSWT
jgi:hypothetical protein